MTTQATWLAFVAAASVLALGGAHAQTTPMENPAAERLRAQQQQALPQTTTRDSDDDFHTQAREPAGPDVNAQINALGAADDNHAYAPGAQPPQIAAAPPAGECFFRPAGGQFQPMQGTFQDDDQFGRVTYDYTGPQKNPQIETADEITYRAKLPMVLGRDTILMGVEDYRKGNETMAGAGRRRIVLKVRSNCKQMVDVKFQFRLEDGAGHHEIYTSPVVAKAPIGSAEGVVPERTVWVTLPASDGAPPDETFRLSGHSYLIIAELLRADDSHTGIKAFVSGPIVETKGFTVQFVPVSLTPGATQASALPLVTFNQDLSQMSGDYIPDYFPLKPHALTTYTRPLEDMSGEAPPFDPADPTPALTKQRLGADLADKLGTAGRLAGADRVVAVLQYTPPPPPPRRGRRAGPPAPPAEPPSDWTRIEATPAVGLTYTRKAVLVRMAPGQTVDTDEVATVAHELIHTLPYIWSGQYEGAPAGYKSGMEIACGADYHNTRRPIAYGERIDTGGYPGRRIAEDGVPPVMGGAVATLAPLPGQRGPAAPPRPAPPEIWISQCTYAHLIDELVAKPDPALLLVRAIISRGAKGESAELRVAYDQFGKADLASTAGTDWAIRLSGPAGRPLAVYGFTPQWETEEGQHRDIMPIDDLVPLTPGATRLEITFKGRTLASHPLGATQPILSVTTGPRRGGQVSVDWTATAAGGGPVKSSVFYSTNGGAYYNDQLFEADAHHWDVVLDPRAKTHTIKVVVTDGGRSREQVVSLGGR
jgi:hypothetical protein